MAIDYWQKFAGNHTYHIYNRAIQNVNLFNKHSEYEDFLSKYKKYLSPYFDTFAYCLMPNHFHFLSRVKPLANIENMLRKESSQAAIKLLERKSTINAFLEDQMRRLFSSYALKYNRNNNRKGALFSQRCKRVMVKKEAQFHYLLCYIHHNPIHHKYSIDFKDWKYSSFNAYLSSKPTNIKCTEALEWIGGLDFFLQTHRDFKIHLNNSINLDAK